MRSQDGARNPWSAPTTELWAPTGQRPTGRYDPQATPTGPHIQVGDPLAGNDYVISLSKTPRSRWANLSSCCLEAPYGDASVGFDVAAL